SFVSLPLTVYVDHPDLPSFPTRRSSDLATGIPMAQVLFAGGAVGTLILPLMIFHQIQLMVCAVLAQRYARRPEDDAAAAGSEARSEEHTSELQSRENLVCRLLLEKKKQR